MTGPKITGPATTGEPPAEGPPKIAFEGWLPPYDAPTGCAWLCPDCKSWATLRENAHAHQLYTGHGRPAHGDQPPAEFTATTFRCAPPGTATATGEPAALSALRAAVKVLGEIHCASDDGCGYAIEEDDEDRDDQVDCSQCSDWRKAHDVLYRAAFAPGPRLSQAERRAFERVLGYASPADLATLAPLLECAAGKGESK